VADDPASDELPRFSRLTIGGGAAAIAATAALLAHQGQAWPLLYLLIPYPFLALVGAVLITGIAARLRRAPADAYVGARLASAWWISRFAFLIANALLLAAAAVAALAGLPVATALFQAFVLVTMLNVTITMGVQCAINVLRAIRGPAGAQS
jgi:hypothetical protein